jgi:uncharacterized protein (TIGR02271 family)
MAMALTQGMKVMSSDGKSLGKIIRIEGDTFIVEKGFFFPKDYAIPISLVRDCRDDECWLSMSRDELQRADTTGTWGSGTQTDYGMGRQASEKDLSSDQQRLTLSEEELDARKRVHEAGEVRVRKDVVTEHRQVDVPVTKEEVHVERVPASSASAPQGEAFREETIRVPVREEEVEVTKRPRVREEVRVSKSAKQEERRVEGEVRREEARIERDDEERGSAARGDEPYGGGTGTGFRRDDE